MTTLLPTGCATGLCGVWFAMTTVCPELSSGCAQSFRGSAWSSPALLRERGALGGPRSSHWSWSPWSSQRLAWSGPCSSGATYPPACTARVPRVADPIAEHASSQLAIVCTGAIATWTQATGPPIAGGSLRRDAPLTATHGRSVVDGLGVL